MAVITRDVDLSVVGANGGGWCTDMGAAIPTAPATYNETLAAAFNPLGAISEEGLTYGFDEDSEQFIAWGLLTPYRTQITRSLRTFQLTMWETNRAICKSIMYRLPIATVTSDASGDFTFGETSAPTPDRRSWVFDVIDGNTLERFFVPRGEVTDRDDIAYTAEEIAGFNATITAYADDTGVTVYHLGHINLTAS